MISDKVVFRGRYATEVVMEERVHKKKGRVARRRGSLYGQLVSTSWIVASLLVIHGSIAGGPREEESRMRGMSREIEIDRGEGEAGVGWHCVQRPGGGVHSHS